MRADKLPTGFQFPIRQRRLKAVLRPYADAISGVHMSAVARSLSGRKIPRFHFEETVCAGEAEAVPTSDGWRYTFVIRSVRSDRLRNVQEEAERVIASDLAAFISDTEALARTDPASARMRRLHLALDIRDNSVHSKSHSYAA